MPGYEGAAPEQSRHGRARARDWGLGDPFDFDRDAAPRGPDGELEGYGHGGIPVASPDVAAELGRGVGAERHHVGVEHRRDLDDYPPVGDLPGRLGLR